jgi:hypothetical protein
MSSNPFRELIDFAECTYDEARKQATEQSAWPDLKSSHKEMRALYEAAVRNADKTGFPLSEWQAKFDLLISTCVDLMLWQQRAPMPSAKQRREMKRTGVLCGPVAGFLLERLKQLDSVLPFLHTCAIRWEIWHEEHPLKANRRLNSTEKKIISYCRRKARKGVSIAFKAEVSETHVYRVLSRLEEEGYIRKAPGGYRAT